MNDFKIDFQWDTFNSEAYSGEVRQGNISIWQPKGLIQGITTITPEGKKFNFTFETQWRLNQEIDRYFEVNEFNNLQYYSHDNNTIVIPEITEENIINAITDIYNRGHLKEPNFVEDKTVKTE